MSNRLPEDPHGMPADWPGSPLSTLHYGQPQLAPTVRKPSADSGTWLDASAPTIVVGTSGSPASARALRWAAGEASRLHGRLKVVLIETVEPRAFYAPAMSAADYERQQRAVAGLAATVRSIAGSMPPDAVATYVTQGIPERALVEQSAGADLLVLGSASGFTGPRSIGPVIRACLSHAHCPVVVVGPEGPLSHAGNDHAMAASSPAQAAAATGPGGGHDVS